MHKVRALSLGSDKHAVEAVWGHRDSAVRYPTAPRDQGTGSGAQGTELIAV